MSAENSVNKAVYHIKHPTASVLSKAVLFFLDNIITWILWKMAIDFLFVNMYCVDVHRTCVDVQDMR